MYSPAKPSRPSRVYLHLTSQDYIGHLSEKVRSTSFLDAKGSARDSALLGPPSVEFAPYGRVPNSRPRKDARQGTIDQDPEFIDFLESLTNPIIRSAPVDQENEAAKGKDKITVTPLIQYLKDKKAIKGKESATAAKIAKQGRHDPKERKSSTIADARSAAQAATAPKKRSAQAVKVEQAARDAVKVLNKHSAGAKGATSAANSAHTPSSGSSPAAPNSTANAALADKRRERGSASAAAKILQRDLGIGGNPGVRGGGRRGMPNVAAKGAAVNTQATQKSDQGESQAAEAVGKENATSSAAASTPNVESTPTKSEKRTQNPPSGPAASRTPSKTSSTTPKVHPTPARPAPTPSISTQAFLKHANPSQGITEPLLEEAFAVFGKTKNLEIDKKKGFAYIDFVEPESLQKAIKASPIKVAQGQVVVLERKTGPSLQARNARGGSPAMNNRGGMPMGGRGGSMRGRGGSGRGAINTTHASNSTGTAAPTPPPPSKTNPSVSEGPPP